MAKQIIKKKGMDSSINVYSKLLTACTAHLQNRRLLLSVENVNIIMVF
jgi:hypothetical protein